MYFYCHVYVFFHRASWHSSATLTEFFPCFSSVVRQMWGLNPQIWGTANTKLPIFLCCSMYCLFFVLFYVLLVLCRFVYCLCVNVYWMCIVLLPPGGYPIAVKKYIISYQFGCVYWYVLQTFYLFSTKCKIENMKQKNLSRFFRASTPSIFSRLSFLELFTTPAV
jgi:hypothetical protein